MDAMAVQPGGGLRLLPFRHSYSTEVAGWVRTAQQLLWLAPSTQMPLTAAKVVDWTKAGGEAFLFSRDGDPLPIAYGELNPMRRRRDHLWLGHVIVRSDQRGHGIGKSFVKALLAEAVERRFANRVSLIVFPDNAPAIRCYLGVGFALVGTEYHQFNRVGPRRKLLRLEITPPLR